MECVRGAAIAKPKAIFNVAQRDEGLALISFYEQDRIVRALAAQGIVRTILDARAKGPEVAQSALVGGGKVLLLGIISRVDKHSSRGTTAGAAALLAASLV